MTAGGSRAAPTGRRSSSRSLLAVLAAVIFCETRAMPVDRSLRPRRPDHVPLRDRRRCSPSSRSARRSPPCAAASPSASRTGSAPMLWIVGGLVAADPAAEAGRLLDRHRRCSSRCTARGFGRGPLWLTIPIGIVVSLRHLADLRRGCCSSRCPPGRSSASFPERRARHGHLRACSPTASSSRCSR